MPEKPKNNWNGWPDDERRPLSPAELRAREKEWWLQFEVFLVVVLIGLLIWIWRSLPEPVKGILR